MSSPSKAVASGWVSFVTMMLLIVGTMHAIWGIGAISKSNYFHEDSLLVSSLTFWGWLALGLGVLQLIAAFLVATRNETGAVIAVFLSFFGVIGSFLAIGAYPVWGVTMIVVNALVIWGVTTHGEEFVE